MTISVVIPTYDTAAMTLRCCRAVMAAAAEGTEIIVSDDGSRDGTTELLAREVPEVRVVRLETNRGFATAANRGVAEASGRIVLLLNSDAIVEEGALQAIVSAFDSDPSLGVAGARLLNDDGTPQWSGGRTPTLPWIVGVVSGAGHLARHFRRANHSAREVDWVSGAAMAFRAEVWSEAGPLSERFRFYCQDIDFCLRARRAGWQVRIVDGARVTHTLGGTIAAGQSERHDPARLWPDLLTWGAAHYGGRWLWFARPVLVMVATARIVLRKLRGRDAASLVRALRRLIHNDA